MGRCLALVLPVLLYCSCAGPRQASDPRQVDAAWLRGQLAGLQTLPCPDGCSPADWDQLKAGLARSIELRLSGKAASTPPQTPQGKPLLQYDAGAGSFFWYFASPGDYDQNGEVNISDLTPLGAHLNEPVDQGFFGYQNVGSVIDGDENGQVNISDLTPLGANLGAQVDEWRVYSSSTIDDYPAEAASPTSLTPIAIVSVGDSNAPPTAGRRRYLLSPVPPDPALWYWVRSAQGEELGVPSNPVGGNNQPPVASYTLSTPSGPLPQGVDFDGSASTDPDGDPLRFLWLINAGDAGASLETATPHFDYPKEGIFQFFFYVIDDQGATGVVDGHVTISTGEKWRVNSPDPAATLTGDDAVSLLEVAGLGGLPAVAYTTGGNQSLHVVQAQGVTADLWNDPVLLAGPGIVAEPDMAIVNSLPAVAYVEAVPGDQVELRYRRATDQGGTDWDGPSTVTSSAASVQLRTPSLGQDVFQRPAIAYWHESNNGDLEFAEGNDFPTTSWTVSTIDGEGNAGFFPMLANINGELAVAYSYGDGNAIRYMDSTQNGGVVWNAPIAAQLILSPALHDGLAQLADGRPALAFADLDLGAILYTYAPTPAGDTFPAASGVAPTGAADKGVAPSLALIRGNPAIAYIDSDDGKLKYVRALDGNGDAWGPPQVVDDANTSVYPELAQTGGIPAIAYESADGGLRLAVFF